MRKLYLALSLCFAALSLSASKAEAQWWTWRNCDNGRVIISDCNYHVTGVYPGYNSEYLIVTDYSFGYDTYNVTVTCTGVINSCYLYPNWFQIGYGWSENLQVDYNATQPGTGKIILSFYSQAIGGPLRDTIYVTVTQEPRDFSLSTSTTHTAPYQNLGICAVSCFNASAAVSTVPYYTMDTPRSVGFVYHGDRAFPRPVIYADVFGTTMSYTISRYEMSATITPLGGSTTQVTFLNGDQTLYFNGSNPDGRLAGQFDAASLATGVYNVNTQVIARYADGASVTKTSSTQLIIVNDRLDGYVAKGWAVSGLQKLYNVPGGGYLVVEGGGDAVYYSGLNVSAIDHTYLAQVGANIRRVYPDQGYVAFYSNGLMQARLDRWGFGTFFDYDGSGRLSLVKESMRVNNGQDAWYLELGYDANGIDKVTEKNNSSTGRITEFDVNASRNLIRVTDPDNFFTGFGYDTNNRLSTITDRKGYAKTFGYDSFSWKLDSETLPQIPVDAGGGNTTNATPVVTYTAWQDAAVVRTPTSPTSLASIGSVYNNAVVTDAISRNTNIQVNSYGQPVHVVDPASRVSWFAYEGIKVSTSHAANGTEVQHYYGGKPYPTTTWTTGQSTRYTAYTSDNLVDSVWGPGVKKQKFMYYSDRRLQHTWWPNGTSTYPFISYWYDTSTGKVNATDMNSVFNYYNYNAATGNLNYSHAPGNRITTKFFDVYGRDSVTKAPSSAPHIILYDILNRVVKDSVPGAVTRFVHDAMYVTDVYDANNNNTHTDYNALGWPTQVKDALGNYSTSRYNAAGLKTSATNRRGQIVNFTYDGSNRLLSKAGAGISDSYTYGNLSQGDILTASNAVSVDSLFKHFGNNTDSSVARLNGTRYRVFHARAINFTGTDSMSIKASSSLTFRNRKWTVDPGSGLLLQYVDGFNTHGYEYDANGDLSKSVGTLGGTRFHYSTTLHRDGRIQFGVANLNSNLYRAYRYDSLGHMSDLYEARGSASPHWISFGYDGLGRLSAANEKDQAYVVGGMSGSMSADYGHSFGASGATVGATYNYDAAGNRLWPGSPTLYGPGNRLHKIRYTGVREDTLTYDLDGNITRRYNPVTGEDRRYYWDAENKLTRVEMGSQSVDYHYNAWGRPVRKYRNGVLDRLWVWDGNQLLLEMNSSGQRLAEYLYMPGSTDVPYAVEVGSPAPNKIRYIQVNEAGNVIGHYEAYSGSTVVNQLVYYDDPWGKPQINITADSRLFWKGLMWEGDVVGLYFVRNRWYDPELGRFVSEDPIGLQGGANLYVFAGNDPVNGWDPAGTWSLRWGFRWRKPWRDIFRWVPVIAFGAITQGAGWTAALKAMGSTAIGSAAAAGVEHVVTGSSFASAFQRNFGLSSLNFVGGAIIGGGVQSAGSHSIFQGYIKVNHLPDGALGLTLGSSAVLGQSPNTRLSKLFSITLGQHEFGHTLQFIGLSAFRGGLGLGPWLPYIALGGVGLAGELGLFNAGCQWEFFAETLGGPGAGHGPCGSITPMQ